MYPLVELNGPVMLSAKSMKRGMSCSLSSGRVEERMAVTQGSFSVLLQTFSGCAMQESSCDSTSPGAGIPSTGRWPVLAMRTQPGTVSRKLSTGRIGRRVSLVNDIRIPQSHWLRDLIDIQFQQFHSYVRRITRNVDQLRTPLFVRCERLC